MPKKSTREAAASGFAGAANALAAIREQTMSRGEISRDRLRRHKMNPISRWTDSERRSELEHDVAVHSRQPGDIRLR